MFSNSIEKWRNFRRDMPTTSNAVLFTGGLVGVCALAAGIATSWAWAPMLAAGAVAATASAYATAFEVVPEIQKKRRMTEWQSKSGLRVYSSELDRDHINELGKQAAVIRHKFSGERRASRLEKLKAKFNEIGERVKIVGADGTLQGSYSFEQHKRKPAPQSSAPQKDTLKPVAKPKGEKLVLG